jgi:hypothetical protein
MRHRLEVQILNHEIAMIDFVGDGRVQFRFLRHRPKAEHLGQLLAILLLMGIPIVGGFDLGEAG